jgi:WD40 repeat protein
MAFKPDGKILVSVGHDGALKRWDVATGKNTSRRQLADWTPAAAVSRDGKTLATAMWVVEEVNGRNVVKDKSIKLWDVETGKEQGTIKLHTACVSPMAFSPDGKTLARGSEDNTIKLWDVAKGNELATLKGHTDKVLSLAFSADGKMLASGSADKTIKLWDAAKSN